jgi:hypothetical protein
MKCCIPARYTPASEGSVGGYRSRYKMDWNLSTGHVGSPGESWQGTLTNGGVPGAPMDFRNKWNNILDFQPVRKLPASALLDEDNPPDPVLPLTEEERAAGAAVEKLPSPECWDEARFVSCFVSGCKPRCAGAPGRKRSTDSKKIVWWRQWWREWL